MCLKDAGTEYDLVLNCFLIFGNSFRGGVSDPLKRQLPGFKRQVMRAVKVRRWRFMTPWSSFPSSSCTRFPTARPVKKAWRIINIPLQPVTRCAGELCGAQHVGFNTKMRAFYSRDGGSGPNFVGNSTASEREKLSMFDK